MRLSEEPIRQGILHGDADVRSACLHYFVECFSPNLNIMPTAIEALERFGRNNAFNYVQPIAGLAQSDETIRWTINELNQRSRRVAEERSYLNHLSKLLCQADAPLVQPHMQEILASPGFAVDRLKSLKRQMALLSWDGDALWRELEAICDEGKDTDIAGDVRFDEAEQIVEALAREGSRHIDRMMSLLAIKIDDCENNPLTWMEPLMVLLGGELHHEPAIPLIVEKMHDDVEIVSEECLTALVKIGTDRAVEAMRQQFPAAEWHFRLYAAGALGRIHTDRSVTAIIELLEQEEDGDLQQFLAQALVDQFSSEGNEAAYKALLSDPDRYDLRRALVPACMLMGQHFPELAQWQQEFQDEKRRKPLFHPPARTPIIKQVSAPRSEPRMSQVLKSEVRVGRNDPCPCGSGKKFKKCCINKRQMF